jgi:hypothetical protein
MSQTTDLEGEKTNNKYDKNGQNENTCICIKHAKSKTEI